MVTFVSVGLRKADVKDEGPVHKYVASKSGVASSKMLAPVHTGELLDAVGVEQAVVDTVELVTPAIEQFDPSFVPGVLATVKVCVGNVALVPEI